MIEERHKETLATAQAVISVVSLMVDAVQNPENTDHYPSATLEHKVASSLLKKISKHLTPAE